MGLTTSSTAKPLTSNDQYYYNQNGEPPNGQPIYGQPPYGSPPYGALPIGAPPYGALPIGAPPYGALPIGVPPYGALPIGAPPYGALPISAPPYGALPIGTPSYGALPIVAPPYGALPIGTPPYGTLPIGAPPYGALPIGTPPYGTLPISAPPYGALPIGSPYGLPIYGASYGLPSYSTSYAPLSTSPSYISLSHGSVPAYSSSPYTHLFSTISTSPNWKSSQYSNYPSNCCKIPSNSSAYSNSYIPIISPLDTNKTYVKYSPSPNYLNVRSCDCQIKNTLPYRQNTDTAYVTSSTTYNKPTYPIKPNSPTKSINIDEIKQFLPSNLDYSSNKDMRQQNQNSPINVVVLDLRSKNRRNDSTNVRFHNEIPNHSFSSIRTYRRPNSPNMPRRKYQMAKQDKYFDSSYFGNYLNNKSNRTNDIRIVRSPDEIKSSYKTHVNSDHRQFEQPLKNPKSMDAILTDDNSEKYRKTENKLSD